MKCAVCGKTIRGKQKTEHQFLHFIDLDAFVCQNCYTGDQERLIEILDGIKASKDQ